MRGEGESTPGKSRHELQGPELMTRHQPSTATLSSLDIDDTPQWVSDELEALALHEPSPKDYASFAANLPAIENLTRRAKHHADQAARFVELVRSSSRSEFNEHAMQLIAVTRLNVVGSLAVALIPPRTPVDRHARREQGHAVLGTLEDGIEHELHQVVRIAFGLDEADAEEIAADAIAHAGRKAGAGARDSGATTHTLEERAALAQYLLTQPDAHRLIAQVQAHGTMAKRLEASLTADELGPEDHQWTAAARFGAHLQQIIALARLRLTHPGVEPDDHPVLAEAVADASVADMAALILAGEQGRHLERMMAAHPF